MSDPKIVQMFASDEDLGRIEWGFHRVADRSHNLFDVAYPEEEGDTEELVGEDMDRDDLTHTDYFRMQEESWERTCIAFHARELLGVEPKGLTGAERQVASNHRRAAGDLTADEWRRIVKAFESCCAYCGAKTWPLQLEHVIPVSMGGLTDASNCVPACAACNMLKRGRAGGAWLGPSGEAEFEERRAAAAERLGALQKDRSP